MSGVTYPLMKQCTFYIYIYISHLLTLVTEVFSHASSLFFGITVTTQSPGTERARYQHLSCALIIQSYLKISH